MSLHPDDGAIVRRAADDVRAITAKAKRVEVALVALAVVCTIAAAGFGGWNTYRIRKVAENTQRLVDAQVEGQQFGIDAVNCIRFSLLEHRWVNEEYHKEQAEKLGLPPPAHAPLPPRPTPAEIERACQVFDRLVTPPRVTTTTTGG